MKRLPLDHPGTPDHRSPGRFLLWLARAPGVTLLGGLLFGIVWMSAPAVLPPVSGRALDRGIAARDNEELLRWALVLFGIGLVQAASGIMRHRFAVTNWLVSAYRVVQLVGRQTTRLGATLPRKVSTGEVVAIGTNDLSHIGQVMDVSARFAGAIVSFFLVSVILLQTSVTLGLVVLVGVPLLMLGVAPILGPLQRRAAHQRHLMGQLSNTASDIVGGLRVLRGIGGEQVFHDRYVTQSQTTRRAGVRVASLQSVLDALQVFLPGLFVVVVVWIGARYAVQGEISPGELVAFYGYSAFLMIPLRTATEYANKVIRGRVAASRICRVLALDPEVTEPETPAVSPPTGAVLADARSGLTVRSGVLTAIVSEQPDDSAELADRLGMTHAPVDDEVTLGGVPLTALSPLEVRSRIVVSDTAAMFFSGRLGDRLDVTGRGDVGAALDTASAADILDALPEGLDTIVAERGRSFSGGQRQRLVLARALAADPEVLVLVEPTSAVDAHTEARIAARLRRHRAGRTTVVTTTSPLMLDSADEVAFLRAGRVVATGTHVELLDTNAEYRRVVTRETELSMSEVTPS